MKKMNGFIAAAACAGLLAGFGAMTFSARAAENEIVDIPEATEEYTGTLPVTSEPVVTTVTTSDENSELEELRRKGQRMVGQFVRQEKILLGELAPDAPRITLDEANDIISRYGTAQEIIREFDIIHKYPDYIGGSGVTNVEYWLDDSGEDMINICLEGDMFAHISFDNGERQAEMYRLDSDLGVAGDVNRDGELNISDLVFLQRWLINKDKNELPDRRLADVNYDGDVDVFDLIALKKLIIGKLL